MPVTYTKSGRFLGTAKDARAFVELLIEGVANTVQRSMDEMAPKLAEEIKNSFEAQKLPEGPFPADYKLDEDYRIHKIKEGLDERIGIRTGSLKNSIKTYKKSPTRWFIGTRKQSKSGEKRGRNRAGHNGNYAVTQYARKLEFGSRGQKARPIWRPNLRAFAPKYSEQTLVNIQKFVKKLVSSV